MLKILAAIIVASLTIVAAFTALPLPFVAPLTPGLETIPVWSWGHGWLLGLHQQSLQVPAALLAGLALGAWLGGLSQLCYLALGLGGLAVFAQGGGWEYWQQPTMGYLLALAPAAAVTALVAGRSASSARLTAACAAGVLTCHALGLPYAGWSLWPASAEGWRQLLLAYLVVPLPGQLLLAAGLAVLAAPVRHLASPAPAPRATR